jgi:NADPH:quinone reductase
MAHTTIDARYVAPIADAVSFERAAAAPVAYATARHMLFDTVRAKTDDWILVRSAAGGVGSAIVQLARNAGLRTVALANSSKLDFVRAQGATVAFDYRRPDLIDSVRAATDGGGIALSLNPVGGATVAEDMALLAPMGTLISFGFLAGPPENSFAELLLPHFNRSVGLRVSDVYTSFAADPAVMTAHLAAIAAALASGDIAPPIEAALPLTKAAEAHRRLEAGEACGKLVLVHD